MEPGSSTLLLACSGEPASFTSILLLGERKLNGELKLKRKGKGESREGRGGLNSWHPPPLFPNKPLPLSNQRALPRENCFQILTGNKLDLGAMIASGCLLATQTWVWWWRTYGSVNLNAGARTCSRSIWAVTRPQVAKFAGPEWISNSELKKSGFGSFVASHSHSLTHSGKVALNILAAETRPSCRAKFSIFSSWEVSRKKKK